MIDGVVEDGRKRALGHGCRRVDSVGEATVRRASATDAEAIAGIQLEVWRHAFSGFLPEQVLDTPVATAAAPWTELISGGVQVLLAAENDMVVGFVHACPATAEIASLLVRPAWSRRGHGGRLFAAATAQLAATGTGSGTWWIPEPDTASQRFAASVGWTATTGTRVLDTGVAPLRERCWTGDLEQQLGPLGF